MIIYLKADYTVIGELSFSEKSIVTFSVPNDSKFPVMVKLNSEDNTVEALTQFEVSKELHKEMEAYFTDNDSPHISKSCKNLASSQQRILSSSTNKVLSLIKYNLNNYEIKEGLFSSRGTFWSTDRTDWKRCIYKTFGMNAKLKSASRIDRYEDSIQEWLSNSIEPFLARKHLARADDEYNPRHMWIEATIAAELAIKEFYIRYKPELEPLLLEVPSPPLHKLYGSVLESYAGERSPKYKEIQKGVATRNKLLHHPKDLQIDFDDARNYVYDVEAAIRHLHKLLYPENRFFKDQYILSSSKDD